MACLTCKRRKKNCDDKRPRCSTCKASHIRCTYDGPPAVFQFCHELSGSEAVEKGTQADLDRIHKTSSQPRQSGDHGVTDRLFERPILDDTAGSQVSDEDLFAGFISSWDDDLPGLGGLDYSTFSNPYPEIQMPKMQATSEQERNDTSEGCTPIPLVLGTVDENPPAKKPRRDDELPTHLLAHHFSTALAGRFSFKRLDWTFYTYFLHRFGQTHPWVLSAILAWTSANLFYGGKTKSLDEALRHYNDSLGSMTEKYGIAMTSYSAIDSMGQDGVGNRVITKTSSDDMDAMFVAYFFLALVDLVMARSDPFRNTLRLMASIIRIPGFKIEMTGVQARVISWFCILDGKASAIQPGEGVVLEAMGDEEALVHALRRSSKTLQQAYSVTYPDEERTADEKHLPLLDIMLRLTCLLHQITKCRRNGSQGGEIEKIRKKLDSYHLAMESDNATSQYEGRSGSTFLVLCALYHSVEISYSRCFKPDARRHAATHHAEEIICITQKLKAMRPAGSRYLPPPTNIWPLPLVMAAIEVKDLIYREWAVQILEMYQQVAGDHYAWSKRFVETVCEKEDVVARRLDWATILSDLNDGIVI